MNSFGRIFRVSIFGESHGERVGVVIDGVNSGLELCEQDFDGDLSRRKSGQKGTTPRKESDTPTIVSGCFNGYTTGAPLTIIFQNENTRSGDYKNLVEHPRPGHSDFVAQKKYYGFNDYRGGGHFSARVTLGIVAAGVVAKKLLAQQGIEIGSKITEIGGEKKPELFEKVIEEAMSDRDSVGGVVECSTLGVPIGYGEPFFDSVESLISHAIFAIPAVRAIEFGEGFESARKRGSHHNDSILDENGKCETNHSGGVNGGISNGNEILFRVAFKPTSSISKEQQSYNTTTKSVEALVIKGRHDACVALRAPVMVEAMTALVLADLMMIKK